MIDKIVNNIGVTLLNIIMYNPLMYLGALLLRLLN
jgi:hypothetical protein